MTTLGQLLTVLFLGIALAACAFEVRADVREFGPSRTAAPEEWWTILEQARTARADMFRWSDVSNWHAALLEYDDRSPIGKVSGVEALIRHTVKFQPERTQRWKLPELTRAVGGDCEDWATLAFVSLAALGVPVEDMRIWGVWSERYGAHAVLYVLIEGEGFFVDSLPPYVASEDSAAKDYELRWSLSPEGKTTYLAGL